MLFKNFFIKKKNCLVLVLFLILFLFLGVGYTYYLRPLVDDELYNFGFAKSIIDGKIPYLDFNMIIPPFFPYFLSAFLTIFGKRLIVYHFLLSLLSVIITYFCFRKIGIRAIAIYVLLLIYPYNGYNLFCLFLIMLLIFMEDFDNKNKDVIDAFLIGIMFLTKQTLGIMIIPSLIFSKNKKKTFLIYFSFLLAMIVYFLIFQNFYSFVDYCFFGMFDFVSKNNHLSILFLIELIILFSLIFLCVRTRKKEYFYILFFQIIVFPAVNYVHFVIGFIPVVYYFLYHFKKNFMVSIFVVSFLLSYFAIFSYSVLYSKNNNNYLGLYQGSGFMKDRLYYRGSFKFIQDVHNCLDKYSDDDVYVLGIFSYLIKLNLDMPINKYDIINNGNMGYHGKDRYISEIDNNCKKRNCVFVINDQEAFGKVSNQVNLDILRYVQENYFQEYSSSNFSVYRNSLINKK